LRARSGLGYDAGEAVVSGRTHWSAGTEQHWQYEWACTEDALAREAEHSSMTPLRLCGIALKPQ